MTISAISFRGTLTQPEKLQHSGSASPLAATVSVDNFTPVTKGAGVRFGGLQADTLKAQKEAHVIHLLDKQLKPTFSNFSVGQVYRESNDQTDLAVTLTVPRPGEKDLSFEFNAFTPPEAKPLGEEPAAGNTVVYQLIRRPEMKRSEGSDTAYGNQTLVTYELTPEGKPLIRYQSYSVQKKWGTNQESSLSKELVSETPAATANAKAFFEGLAGSVRQKVAENADSLVYPVDDLVL